MAPLVPRPTKHGHKQGQGSALATAAAGTAPATFLLAQLLGEQATAPDSGTVARAATTTQVQGVTAGLATMAVAVPSTAPPAVPSATPVAPAVVIYMHTMHAWLNVQMLWQMHGRTRQAVHMLIVCMGMF